MKKMLLAFICISFAVCGGAQKVYFIYMQSENQTPFYARMGDKVFSSSPIGYLIIPSLKDSTYAFFIGYPGSRSNGIRFDIALRGADKGFLVRNTGNSILLSDLQSGQVQNAAATGARSGAQPGPPRTDVFTTLLSEVSDDPSLLLSFASTPTEEVKKEVSPAVSEESAPVPKEADPVITKAVVNEPVPVAASREDTLVTQKETPSTAVIVPDTKTPVTESKTNIIQEEAAIPLSNQSKESSTVASSPVATEQALEEKQPAAETTPYIRSVVVRRSESSTTEGFGLVFLDNINGNTDTIRLLIPNSVGGLKREERQPAPPVSAAVTEESAPGAEVVTPKNVSRQVPCFSATDKDFFKLRKNMASEGSEERMISVAKRYFRTRCFTTEQVRNLSSLFLTPASRYNFFDAAYTYVTDRDKFSTLSSEIKDEYYSNRFKALAGIE